MLEQYTCSFLKEKLSEGAQLIDVRSPMEFKQGALEGAINMPIDTFLLTQDKIDSTKAILLYCRTGARSGMVKRHLEQLGFDKVHNIGGVQQFITC